MFRLRSGTRWRSKFYLASRCAWFVSVCAGIFGIIWISLSIWNRYQMNPTVISMERNYQEWNTSLPAVTICPVEKLDVIAMQKYIQKRYPAVQNKTKLQEFFKSLTNATYHSFKNMPRNAQVSPSTFLAAFLETGFKFKFDDVTTNLEGPQAKYLQPTLTEMGMCVSHNSKVAVYNDPSYWKTNKWNVVTNVTTLFVHPLDGDVFVQVLNMNSGSKVFFHNSEEIPDITNRFRTSPPYYFETLHVSALSIYSTKEVRSLTVKQRSCLFWDEGNLLNSPVYSYNMCRVQCRMKLSHALCACVPFFYRPSGKYKVCGVDGMHCLANHMDNLVKIQVNSKGSKTHGCECLSPCDDTNYQIELESTEKWFLGTSVNWGLIKYPRLRLKRDILFGFSDLLVQIGGTAGLFLGGSILSFIETGYFITLRFFWFLYQTK